MICHLVWGGNQRKGRLEAPIEVHLLKHVEVEIESMSDFIFYYILKT